VCDGPDAYQTVGTSRAVAVTAEAPSVEEARATVSKAIETGFVGDLQWRTDIGIVPGPRR